MPISIVRLNVNGHYFINEKNLQAQEFHSVCSLLQIFISHCIFNKIYNSL